ncbi:hypothetical protein B0H14DRAFT_2646182 [Mycena olivaceomarginata]|nr:hypothetical protein B0H14DRAFT_2646182 [Mycena olivaceomarginata]
MSRGRPGNRWTIFSSDIDNDEPEDDNLPPSDPPDRSENDSSESDTETPIQRMPALTSLLGAVNDTDSAPALDSSPPPPAPNHRSSHRGSSVPPADSPDDIDLRTEHPTSDDILWTPRTEKQFLRQRAEVQRQQSRVANRAERVCSYAICGGYLADPSSGHCRRVSEAGG